MEALGSLSSIDYFSFADDDPGKRHALRAAQDLVPRVETFWDTLTRLIWIQPNRHAVLLTSIDINLFETLYKISSAMEAERLAERFPVVVDTALLSRILRMLVATGDLKYVADEKFAPTTFSTAIATVTGVKAAIKRAVDMKTDGSAPFAPVPEKDGLSRTDEYKAWQSL